MATDPPTILLFSPTVRVGGDFETALRARGFEVVRAASTRSLVRHLDAGGIHLVVLDSASWHDTARAVQTLDDARLSVPRIWVSASSDAPARSGHMGIDALLIDPDDVAAIVASVERFLAPHLQPGESASRVIFAGGTHPPRARPRGTGPVAAAAADRSDGESSTWDDPTSDWHLRGRGAD